MKSTRVFGDFNEAELKRIAKLSDNKQVVADVGYASFIHYHQPDKLYIQRTENAFFIGMENKKAFRIIGMATAKEARGTGIGTRLLNRAIAYAKSKGYGRVETRSLSGVQFYMNRGFEITGMKGKDFLLSRSI